jgi:hypothetical protein
MDAPHTIRLRGPWELRPLARTVLLPDGTTVAEPLPLPDGGSQQIPSDWSASLGADFRGRVRYVRWFHRPTNLTSEDRVVLRVVQVDAWGEVALNESPLGEIAVGQTDWQCDVTGRLLPRNQLCLEVELPRLAENSPALPRGGRDGLPGGLIGEVALQIFAAHDVPPPVGTTTV